MIQSVCYGGVDDDSAATDTHTTCGNSKRVMFESYQFTMFTISDCLTVESSLRDRNVQLEEEAGCGMAV